MNLVRELRERKYSLFPPDIWNNYLLPTCLSLVSMSSVRLPRFKLFGYLACPYVQRVRCALNHIEADYVYEEIDILRGQ